MTHWLILGAGGHGRSVADAIRAGGDAVAGFLDDGCPAGELVDGVPVIGPLALAHQLPSLPIAADQMPERLIVAIGNPNLRQHWQQVLQDAGAAVGTVIHPAATVSPAAQLAPGCVVLAGAVINANARLDSGVVVNSGAVIDHDAICSAYSQLGVNATMAGGSRLGTLASLQAGQLLGRGENRVADMQLVFGASDLSEGMEARV